MSIGVLVVEDHLVARVGLRTVIEHQPDMRVAGEAKNGAEAVAKYRSHRPDVVLMDLRLPVMDGVAATAIICKEDPAAKVLVFSSFDAEADVRRAQAAGARGYVLKSADSDELLDAIRAVAEGRRSFAADATARLEGTVAPDLNARDRELLNYLVRGLSNPEIAEVAKLTPGTVRVYLTRLFLKLQVSNRTEAVTAAFDRGLVKPDWSDPDR